MISRYPGAPPGRHISTDTRAADFLFHGDGFLPESMVVSTSSSESAIRARCRFVEKLFLGRDEIRSRLHAPRRLCRLCQAIACLLGRTLTVLPMMMVVVVPIILQYVSIRVQAWPKRLVLCDPYEKPYQPGPPQLTVSLVLCVTLRSCYFMRSLASRMLGRPFLNLPSVINKDEHGPARIPHMRSWLEGTYGKISGAYGKFSGAYGKFFWHVLSKY